MTIDLVYLTFNRLEFTRFTWEQLLENTDWTLVRRLLVYDNSSIDGTFEWIREQLQTAPVPWDLISHDLRSPPAVMNSYLADWAAGADAFAKIDNDIVVPPGWLTSLAAVADAHPRLDLLGTESGRLGLPTQDFDGTYTWEPASHIGGVGLMRTRAFTGRPMIAENGRFGFTEWQHAHRPVMGWIKPDLAVTSLDQIPFNPWRTLSRRYIRLGWQRRWPRYDERFPRYWEWWAPEEVPA